jgi:HprK-related kinase B
MTGTDERPDSNAAAALMTGGLPVRDAHLTLGLEECTLALRSNSSALIEELREYFGASVVDDGVADIEVIAVEQPPLDIEESLDVRFVDWAREPGKEGRKDAYVDLTDGRLVRKVRTGMLFLQRDGPVIAAGPCRQHPNQVINFVNAQYMNHLQQQGWLICHAAASTANEQAIGLAGFSGRGKSTLMLHLMEQPGVGYLTNDRLFVRREDESLRARGIPKLPRVNPGTIIGNPRLHGLISQVEHDRFAAMPRDQLWELEQKHDVHIDRVYGLGRIAPESPLAAFVVLNWQRDENSSSTLEQVELAERGDLLATIMKSPGPFYQYSDGHFYADDTAFDDAAYLQALQGVPVFEVTGGIDFPRISARVAALLTQPRSPEAETHHDT